MDLGSILSPWGWLGDPLEPPSERKAVRDVNFELLMAFSRPNWAQNGAKKAPFFRKKRDQNSAHFLISFLEDFELIMESILDPFSVFSA